MVNGGGGYDFNDFELAIIAHSKNFYKSMKLLEEQKFPCNKIIDGLVLWIQNLDLPRLIEESTAYGILPSAENFGLPRTIYPLIYKIKDKPLSISTGIMSYMNGGGAITGTGRGEVVIGKFCPISWKVTFELGGNWDHNYKNVSSCPAWYFSLNSYRDFLPPQGKCQILIGNDVWIGHDCILKSSNPNKPLIIGDGAVIASNSVVVKNVPPYAIVGGNPAQIIKYRFPPHVIESLLRIKWWDWSLDKIYDNFKYFNDVEKFVSMHDK